MGSVLLPDACPGVDSECQCWCSLAAIRNSCLDLQGCPPGLGQPRWLRYLSCPQAVPASPRQWLAPGAQQRLLPRAQGGFGVSWGPSSGQSVCRQGCKRPAGFGVSFPSAGALPGMAGIQFGAVVGGRAQEHPPALCCDRGDRAQPVLQGLNPFTQQPPFPFGSCFPWKNRSQLHLLLMFAAGWEAECPVLRGCPQQSWQSSLTGTDPSSHHCCGDQSDLLGEIWVFPSTKKGSVILESMIPGVCPCALPG